MVSRRRLRRAAIHDDLEWLQRTTNRMVRCRSVPALLDLAYDAIREGLGYDRVGLLLADPERPLLIERIGTDEAGRRVYPAQDAVALEKAAYRGRLLSDPRLAPDGPGYIVAEDVAAAIPPYQQHLVDGRPRHTIFVALRTAERVLGLISVDNLVSGRPITAEHAPPLLAFANALAVALENVSLLEERTRRIEDLDADLRRHVAELEWLRGISRRITAARTLDEVLDVVYYGVRDGLGYDRVGIQLFDHARGIYEELRGTDEHGAIMRPHDRSFRLAQDAAIWRYPGIAALLSGAEFYHTNDVVADCPPDLQYLLDGRPAHTLCVPLHAGEQVTGMIMVDNLLSQRPIAPQDAGPLLALANHVGTAVENARLHERERAERARLEVLLESSRALNSTLNRDRLLHVLAERLVCALNASAAFFCDIDWTARTDRVIACHSAPGRPPLFGPETVRIVSLDDYPMPEQVLRTRTPYCAHLDDPDLPPSERGFLQEFDLHSEILVPVIVAGEATSTLEVYWDHAVEIGDEIIELCRAIAEQAAVALENARLYADAAERAEHDALTGLLNHRALLERLDDALASGGSCALLLLDVNNFKLFNDTYGHPTGDAVLTRVGATLREALRVGDVAGRYGGDEFALLLPGAGAGDAAAVARRLMQAVRAQPYVTAEGMIIPLSISVGMASAPYDGLTRQELVAVADAAMYAAKRGDTGQRALLAADLLGDSPVGVLQGLVQAVDAKDRYTCEHSEDVTRWALLLATAVGQGPEEQRVLAAAGPLHDVGKIAVPDRILRKPGRLSAEEMAAMQRHVAYGVAIIRGVLDDEAVVEAVAYHHERWDGRGYPHGLSGPETPLLGRIMQVADAVSAMRLDRPYRQGLPWERVVAELRAGAGAQFDPALVEPFIAAVEAYPQTAAS